MRAWQLFSDPRFELRFRYPRITPQGLGVDLQVVERGPALRAHLVSPGSAEVYFELTRYAGLSAEQICRQHADELKARFEVLDLAPVRAASLAGAPALGYAFRWPQGERAVVAAQSGPDAYRVLYNPASEINEQIRASLEWAG